MVTRPRATTTTRLVDLLALLPDTARLHGDADTGVTGLTLATQRVHPGDLYAALPGGRAHGADFVAQALEAGAVAVLTDTVGLTKVREVAADTPVIEVPQPREVLGRLAATVYGHAADDLRMIGVTGTQGKTTTTRLLEAALEAADVPSAVIGTVGTRILGREVKTSLTTPEAPDLHALFAAMKEQGVTTCAMEVSSHSLVMGRVDGVVFDVAAFLNLGRDHLDFHEDLEDYFRAKASLFTPERARLGLVNVDDDHGRRLVAEASIPMRTFSTEGAEADWRAVDISAEPAGSSFTVIGPGGVEIAARVPLAGAYNVSNALCAIALAAESGLDAEAVARAMADGPGVPGRLERIDEGQDFLVVVDYAHKPDAVEAALTALRPMTQGRLVLLIGAGGDRDTGKRPLMGEIGARLADVVIVTDDNPRSEDPESIRAAVVAGAEEVPMRRRAEVVEIGDRGEAIRQAIDMAATGDVVIVAGKGHETGQEINGVVHPFDDRDQVRAALTARAERDR